MIAPTTSLPHDTATQDAVSTVESHPAAKPARRDKSGRSTSHLKLVPETLEQREQVKTAAEKYAAALDRSRPFTKNELEAHGRKLLEQLELPEKFLGFAMVLVGNFFWKRQFLSIPFNRRMLLLPHCLKHADGCPADYDEFGLDCEKCGACSIADYKVKAEQLGYKVLVAEGSPVVLKIIVSGHIDGILGVACLNVLEKAIDKVLIAGVPSYAVPLHSGDCKNTTLDEAWVWDCLDRYEPLEEPATTGYLPLMRGANKIFDEQFDQLVPATRGPRNDAAKRAPLSCTEAIGLDWLQHGGKRLRPFITLAAYDAVTGAKGLNCSVDAELPEYPAAVSRVALAMEAFHKASLVHDDIEDDDPYRYGQETLHKQFDLGTAINVGDYLIGLGYRLISLGRSEVGAEAAADVVDRLATAHMKLCEGQGAELQWHTARTQLTALDAMKIYALKTSPAFEAALYAGLRLAGPTDAYDQMIPAFSRHVGVGFQILNDLKDWGDDHDNKRVAGRDAETAKPTLLLALALEAANPAQRLELDRVLNGEMHPTLRMDKLKQLYMQLGVFDKAEALVDKCRTRAEALADETQPEELRQLLYFIIDTVLAPEAQGKPAPTVSLSLPVIAAPARK